MKQAVDEEKLKEALSAEERQKIVDATEEAIKWLDGNQLAEKEEFEAKQKAVEAICSPIITKAYQAAGGAPGGE